MERATGGVHLPYQGLLGMLRNVEPMGHCCWESVLLWPLMWPDGKGWAPFKVDTWTLPLSERLVRSFRANSHLFSGRFPNMAMLAMRIDLCWIAVCTLAMGV